MKNILKIATVALAIIAFASCGGNTTVKEIDTVKKNTTIVGYSTKKDTTTVTTTVKKDSVKK